MTTVGDLLDRLERDYLYPPSEQPHVAILDGGLSAGGTSVVLDTRPLSDMAAELGPGLTLAIGQEEMLTLEWDPETSTFDVHRPNPVAHLDGSTVYVAPQWSRRAQFEAVADAIDRLYPDLWTVKTAPMVGSVAREWMPAPKDLVDVISYTGLDGTRWEGYDLEYIAHHPQSPHGIIQLPIGVTGGYITYRAKFTPPTTEADTLESLGVVDRSWHRIVLVDAMADLLAGRDVPKLTIEFITKALEAQGVELGTASDLRNALLQYRRLLMNDAIERLAVSSPVVTIEHQGETRAWY